MGKPNGFREYERKEAKARPIDERIKDSKEVYIPLNEKDVKMQGARCMNCGVPFCNYGCPLGNLMPDVNDFVYKGEWKKAIDRLSMTNSFPEFTGRVCPALCEGACTLGINEHAVNIKEVEKFVVEKGYKEGYIVPHIPKVRTGKKIAIVGSGPSGLSAAQALNSVGHEVHVFERKDELGGVLRYGIPDFKLEKGIIDRKISVLEKEGIVFKTDFEVGKDINTNDLLKEFDAVLLTGGCSCPRDLKIGGRDLKGIYFALDFLTNENRKVSGKSFSDGDIYAEGKNVLVIGGGDTGSDCIGTAIRQGASKVYQYEIMPKPPIKRDDSMPWPQFPRIFKTTTSHEEGCEREFCVGSKRFDGTSGHVSEFHGVKLRWEKDNTGKLHMSEIKGTEFMIYVDMVILAMGFLHPEHLISDELNLRLDARGNIWTDKAYMTSHESVFAAGDMRRGQSLVVHALHEGREAAKSIDKYLMGETSLI